MHKIYKIVYERRVAKDLSKIPHEDVMRIFSRIEQLAKGDIELLDIRKLKGYTENLYRMRVGDYRVIYEQNHDVLIVYVLQIGHRKDIYM